MTAEDKANGIEYLDDYGILSKVPNQKTIVISNKTHTIYGSSELKNAFYESQETLESFSFMDNPNLTQIQDFAFYNCTHLKSINLSVCTKLTTIGQKAFYNCNSVTDLVFPNSIQRLGSYCFQSIHGKDVIIPASLTSTSNAFQGVTFNSLVFEENTKITSLAWHFIAYSTIDTFQIPASVTSVGGDAFEGVSLSSITVQQGSKSYFVSDGILYTIGMKTLVYCPKNLKDSYDVPYGTETIGYAAFLTNKIRTITFPSSLEIIDSYSFYSCRSLNNIIIPASVKSIGVCSFYYCTSLTNITFLMPSCLQSIGSECFLGCIKLDKIVLPLNISSIGGGAFSQCKSDLIIEFDEDSLLKIDKDQFIIMTKDEKIVSSYIGSIEKFNITIPAGIEKIGASAFINSKIYSVAFNGSSLNSIETGAFNNCPYLTEIEFPSSLSKIDQNAFKGTGIIKINLPALTNLNQYAFSGCSKLTDVTIESLEMLPISCFEGCTSLQSCSVKNLKTISTNCFYGCSSLSNFDFVDSITFIGETAFSGTAITKVDFSENSKYVMFNSLSFYECSKLNSISFSSETCELGEKAFYGTSFEEFVVPKKVGYIDDSCFAKCRLLKRFIINEDCYLNFIGNLAFQSCSSLESITCDSDNFTTENGALYDKKKTSLIVFPPNSHTSIFCFPQSVRSISIGAFYECKNLFVVTIPENSITYISSKAFHGCSNIRTINIPSCITTIGDEAFAGCKNIQCGQTIGLSSRLINELVNTAKFPIRGLKPCSLKCTCNNKNKLQSRLINNVAIIVMIS